MSQMNVIVINIRRDRAQEYQQVASRPGSDRPHVGHGTAAPPLPGGQPAAAQAPAPTYRTP